MSANDDLISVEERNAIFDRTGGGEAYGLEVERVISARIRARGESEEARRDLGRKILCDLEELRAQYPGF